MQHRPFAVGEDRNIGSGVPSGSVGTQHRPFAVGEDRNEIRAAILAQLCVAAPAVRGR